MGTSNARGERERWARLRFAVVGPLLASPPPRGRLRVELERLAQQHWEHPCGEGPVRFSASTIERWYYRARAAHHDPVRALRARPRTDAGRVRAMSAALVAALRSQYRDHPSWSAQLHHDNLHVRVDADPSLGPMPSYATLTRVMRSLGLVRQRRRLHHEPERPATCARVRETRHRAHPFPALSARRARKDRTLLPNPSRRLAAPLHPRGHLQPRHPEPHPVGLGRGRVPPLAPSRPRRAHPARPVGARRAQPALP